MNRSRLPIIACFFICFLLIAGIQRWSGADQAAFNGYPDEPSHYLSGLMVHDYLLEGFPTNPRQYALNYYLHIPYFAIGYWPPLFYVAEGLWMTIVGYSRPETLLFMAFIAALISATIFAMVRPVLGLAGASCCALLFLLLPDVLTNSSMVMTDTAVVLLGFWSLLALARYFENGAWRDSILFALLASCAIMTKYSGLYLALVPPLALLIGKRWDLLRRPSFWIQPLLVMVFCGPWILYTHQYAAFGYESFVKPGVAESFVLNLRLWTLTLGPWVSILLFGAWAYQAVFLAEANSLRRILWIQPLSLVFFQSVSPVCCETRWLISGLPPLIVLLAFALARLPKWYGPAVLAATVAVCSTLSLIHFRRPLNTISPVVDAVVGRTGVTRQLVVYVPSDEEGQMIAEFALRDAKRPVRILARPNKLLAKMDWAANHYKSDYEQPADLEHYFKENAPDLLILHERPPQLQFSHERLLEATVHQYPDCWRLLLSTSGHEVYQFTGPHKDGDSVITPLFRSRVNARFEAQ